MANWDKISSRGKVTDRRGVKGGFSTAGVTGIVLLMGVTYLMGGNPLNVLQQVDIADLQTQSTDESGVYAGKDNYEQFVSAVLGSTNDVWTQQFAATGRQYSAPELVLFRGRTTSGCGGAASAVGPHYCPADQTIYLDETFFEELTKRLGAQGGDVAEAYVIAHEVGHHVQQLLGELSGSRSNAESIAIELRADCYAGMWAHSLRDTDVFAAGEITEAIDAAAAVGDDSIQKRTQSEIQPETWTHGSSAQRVAAFNAGYNEGDLVTCQSL
jgi:predicted metalloprotease